MPQTQSTHEERVRAFWVRHVEKVRESGAAAPSDRWLVVRAEESVAAHPGLELAEQSPADVDVYLPALGRKPGVKGWQVRQSADAIRVLPELAGPQWVDEVDRAHRQASARDLGPSHPTMARDSESVASDRASGAPDALPFSPSGRPMVRSLIGPARWSGCSCP